MAEISTSLNEAEIRKAIAFWVKSGMPNTSTKGVTIRVVTSPKDAGHYAPGGGTHVLATCVASKEVPNAN